MKILGNMHPDYKGLAMYSKMSPYMLKSTFLYFIKFFMQEISIIFIDTVKEKITWYNKSLYLGTRKAIICIDNMQCACLKDNKIVHSLKREDISTITYYLNELHIIEDTIVYDCHKGKPSKSTFLALLHYQVSHPEDQNKEAEELRLKLGEHIHNYLLLYDKTPADVAAEFDKYVEDKYDKTVYIVC
jgi:hypothetical protein